jgi:cytochrome c1
VSHHNSRGGSGGKHEAAAIGFVLLVFAFLILKLVTFVKRFAW